MCTEAPHGGAELLEVEGEDAHRAGNVARELLQARRFLEIVEDELVQAEMRASGACSARPRATAIS